jgi:hypothetical protein
MKTLDHVMLWVARGFVVALFAYVCMTSRPALIPHIVIILWGVALWRYTNLTSRLFLGVSSSLALVIVPLVIIVTIYGKGPDKIQGPPSFGFCFSLVGYVSMLWTACRARTLAKFLSDPV